MADDPEDEIDDDDDPHKGVYWFRDDIPIKEQCRRLAMMSAPITQSQRALLASLGFQNTKVSDESREWMRKWNEERTPEQEAWRREYVDTHGEPRSHDG